MSWFMESIIETTQFIVQSNKIRICLYAPRPTPFLSLFFFSFFWWGITICFRDCILLASCVLHPADLPLKSLISLRLKRLIHRFTLLFFFFLKPTDLLFGWTFLLKLKKDLLTSLLGSMIINFKIMFSKNTFFLKKAIF